MVIKTINKLLESRILIFLFISYLCDYYYQENNSFKNIVQLLSCITYSSLIYKIFHIIRRLFLIRGIQHCENRTFLYPLDWVIELKKEIKQIVIYLLLLFVQCILFANAAYQLIWMTVILASIFMIYITSFSDKNEILEAKMLNIGYGAALNYYNNYLEEFISYKLNERIENFKSYHQVHVEKKLFILMPKSCKIQRYLDEIETIERCQELPAEEVTQGGIKDRVYNITVYLIKAHKNGKGVRMAVEYGQPLKQLFAFKEKKIITEQDMYFERNSFLKHLRTFLKNCDSYKFCELIDYDDEKETVSEVLLRSCGIILLKDNLQI